MLTDTYGEAPRLAEKLHRDQRRKGAGTVYVTHLLSFCETWYYRALGDAFAVLPPAAAAEAALTRELGRVVSEIEAAS